MTTAPSHRITPEWITRLAPNQCFGFASNEAGIHGTGAAIFAKFNGAIPGQGYGHMGNTFGIPTKPRNLKLSLPLSKIQEYVNGYIEYASGMPHIQFLTTRIGCLRAGYTPEQIAPLFRSAMEVENIWLPLDFWAVLLAGEVNE